MGPWHGCDIIGLSPGTGANYDSIVHASAAGYLTLEETFQIIDDMNSGKYMYDPLREDLKRFPEDLTIMVTPYGDYIAFRDADSWGDYAIATAGVLPFAKYIKVAGKVVKVETKAAQTLVKDAEAAYKAGNVAEGNRLMNQVASQSTQVETTVIRQAHSSNAGKGNRAATQSNNKYSGGLVKVNKPDAADALAQRIGGESRVRFANDGREFDCISDMYIAQTKPALQQLNKSVRDQMKATFEAAKDTNRSVYYHFEGQPSQSVINKLNEYSNRYGVKVVIDTKPLNPK